MEKLRFVRYLLCGVVAFSGLILLRVPAATSADTVQAPFLNLQTQLALDGFERDTLAALYQRSDVYFDTKTVGLFFVHSEARLNYGQFTSRSLIRRAREYMQQYHAELTKAESRYGVDPEIITAIILVETKLGRYLGGSHIFRTLSTMAALTDPALREKLWLKLPEDRRISRTAFDKKADRRSGWAYRELKALLTYSGREGLDPAGFYGSYAGAMGISQFMPTNILAYARDGNEDGKIDLFDHADAIASVASYLKHYGWRPGIEREKAFKVVYRYNHSDYYVKTILKISDLLKG